MPRNTKQVLYEALTTIPIDQSIVSGLGTVTSVSMTTPSILNVSGSPVTSSGTLGLTLATQTANTVFSGPTSGGAATPTFRALVAADIPSLSGTYQPLDATLTALAGLTIAADSLTIGTGADAFNQTTFAANTFPARASTGSLVAKTITDFALTILDDTDAASVRATIGAGTGGGSVTSVGFTGGLISVATATTTPALTVAGTSGGGVYFSSTSTWASTALLAANAIMIGGGAGAAYATTTTGAGVLTALGVNTGTAGAFVVNGGALGTPSSGTLTNCTFPTLNQNTTGSAAKWTTARNLAGNSVDGSANVAFANKFIVQGTTDTGLSAAQFLGALGTGIVKNTTTTGVLSIAVAADFPTLNQNTTGSAAMLTTARAIYGNNFDGSAALTQIIASTYGGTGNGFTKFSGPATAEKTFTLPNASATILTSNAAVTIAQGGTNATSFGTTNGVAYYNGTSIVNGSNFKFDGTTVTAASGLVVGAEVGGFVGSGSHRSQIIGTGTQSNIMMTGGAVGIEMWKDTTPTRAWFVGMSQPGGGVANDYIFSRYASGWAEMGRFTDGAVFKIGGTATRGTTEGSYHIDLFNCTAPVGTLTNGASLYVTGGEMRVMDSAGNSTLLSPHDKDGNWIHDEINYKGRRLRVDMERMVKALDELLGGGFVQEFLIDK